MLLPCSVRITASGFVALHYICLHMLKSSQRLLGWAATSLVPIVQSERWHLDCFFCLAEVTKRCVQCATCSCITALLIHTIVVYIPFKIFFTVLLHRLQLVEVPVGRCCLAPKSRGFGCQHCLNHFYRAASSVIGALSKGLAWSSKFV